MILGYILIGWIGGGLASAAYLTSTDGSVLAALGLFFCASSASTLLAAVAATLPCSLAPAPHAAGATAPSRRMRGTVAQAPAPHPAGSATRMSPWPEVPPAAAARQPRGA